MQDVFYREFHLFPITAPPYFVVRRSRSRRVGGDTRGYVEGLEVDETEPDEKKELK